MLGFRYLCCVLIGLSFVPSFAFASIEVYGLDQPAMATVEYRGAIVSRLDQTWTQLTALLRTPNTDAPLVYLYPFDRTVQPAELTELQDRFVETIPDLKTKPSMVAKLFSRINGITYDPQLFPEGSSNAGRLIQINTNRSYLNEAEFDRGYGLYITAHEMVHVALNRLGVDKKYQHCLMVDADSNGQTLMRKIFDFLLQHDWVSPMLSGMQPRTKGYAEEASHCAADVAAVRQTEGADGFAAFWREVGSIHQRLGY